MEEPPPFVVLVQGPPGVGKSLLIKCLIKHYTRQTVNDLRGPITLVSAKSRRLTFIECPQVRCRLNANPPLPGFPMGPWYMMSHFCPLLER